jgi:hypothetical protein
MLFFYKIICIIKKNALHLQRQSDKDVFPLQGGVCIKQENLIIY